MAKINLKSIYASEDKYTVLQLIKALIDKVDEIDFATEEEVDAVDEKVNGITLYLHTLTVSITNYQGTTQKGVIRFNCYSKSEEPIDTDLKLYNFLMENGKDFTCSGYYETDIITRIGAFTSHISISTGTNYGITISVLGCSDTVTKII